MDVKIKILSDGYFWLDKGLLVYGKMEYYGQKCKCALKPLLVMAKDNTVLIDTGIGELPSKYAQFYKIERITTLEKSLAVDGLVPEDINIVINTHLHFDHCGNNYMFKNATFYVQKKELAYAKNPHRFQKGGYVKELFDSVKYTEVDGDCEITDGIRVLLTDGHTPGHQSVVIEYGDKKYVYCGDVCPLRENLEKVNIVGILYEPVRALESIYRLKSIRGAEYIYSHDNEQMKI